MGCSECGMSEKGQQWQVQGTYFLSSNSFG